MAHFHDAAKGGRIEAGGMMTADRDLTFEDLEIGGLGTIGGNGKGTWVRSRFSVHGSLELTGKLEVGGQISVAQAATQGSAMTPWWVGAGVFVAVLAVGEIVVLRLVRRALERRGR